MEQDPSTQTSKPEELIQISPDRFFAEMGIMDEARQKVQAAESELEDKVIKEGVHTAVEYHAAHTAGDRHVTDPYGGREVRRPRESASMKLSRTLRVLGRFARKNTTNIDVYNSERAETPSDTHETLQHETGAIADKENIWRNGERKLLESDVAERGLFGAARAILAARRDGKQKLRQDRAKATERVYGTGRGKGRGKQAGIATKINRFKMWRDINSQFTQGKISASDRKQMIKTWTNIPPTELKEMAEKVKSGEMTEFEYRVAVGDSGRAYTNPKAVRRDVRRERTGAAYNHVRAKRPVSKAYRTGQRIEAERQVELAQAERQQAFDELAALNDRRIERERRQKEDSDD